MLDPLEAYALDLHGYLVVKRAFLPGLVQRLGDALVALERRPPGELPADCPASWTPVVNEVRFLNVLAAAPEFAEPIDHPAVLARVREIVPGPQRLTEAYSITRARGVGLHLHSIENASYRSLGGRPRCDHLTAVVALTDCGPEDGPFVVLAGSHKLSVPFPYPTVHPGWEPPFHDRAIADAELRRQPPATRDIPWEAIPGYTEVCVEAGDLVLFVQSLWHGAKELRSGRVRRSLYYSYSPYNCCNWHGIEWTDELRSRTTPARRELLGGPFHGTRYPGVALRTVPDETRFPSLPDSELGARDFTDEPTASPSGTDGAIAAIAQQIARALSDGAATVHRTHEIVGRCRFEAHDANGRGWTLALARDDAGAEFVAADSGEPDAVVEAAASELAAVLAGVVDPSELFHCGRVQVRGDLGLAMRLLSSIGV